MIPVILAAGNGTRMNTESIPKPLYKFLRKPMLEHVIEKCLKLDQKEIIVVSNGDDRIKQLCSKYQNVRIAIQYKQLGTAHALQMAINNIDSSYNDDILIMCCDTPAIETCTLRMLTGQHNTRKNIYLLSTILENPFGYGRLVRDSNKNIQKIVEQKECTREESCYKEINTGIIYTNIEILRRYIPIIEKRISNRELYLTDIIEIAHIDGISTVAINTEQEEVLGINTIQNLIELERIQYRKKIEYMLNNGIYIMDTNTFYPIGNIDIESCCFMYSNVIIEEYTNIKSGTYIHQNCYIKNSTIGKNSIIHANTIIEDSIIGDNCIIGPFARIRPNVTIKSNAHIGNFVEMKNTNFGENSKANHLSYIGDATIGENVNIGAGTITCNYDGISKHKTTILDGVFIGSDTQLVAPITIGKNATIGAGTTVTKDVSEGSLALSRTDQIEISDYWKKKRK